MHSICQSSFIFSIILYLLFCIMIVLFIYNTGHIRGIRKIYDLFRGFGPRAGVLLKNKDKYGRSFGFITVNDNYDWKRRNGTWINGKRVFFSRNNRRKNMNQDVNIEEVQDVNIEEVIRKIKEVRIDSCASSVCDSCDSSIYENSISERYDNIVEELEEFEKNMDKIIEEIDEEDNEEELKELDIDMMKELGDFIRMDKDYYYYDPGFSDNDEDDEDYIYEY